MLGRGAVRVNPSVPRPRPSRRGDRPTAAGARRGRTPLHRRGLARHRDSRRDAAHLGGALRISRPARKPSGHRVYPAASSAGSAASPRRSHAATGPAKPSAPPTNAHRPARATPPLASLPAGRRLSLPSRVAPDRPPPPTTPNAEARAARRLGGAGSPGVPRAASGPLMRAVGEAWAEARCRSATSTSSPNARGLLRLLRRPFEDRAEGPPVVSTPCRARRTGSACRWRRCSWRRPAAGRLHRVPDADRR